jgi:hypothetical protein
MAFRMAAILCNRHASRDSCARPRFEGRFAQASRPTELSAQLLRDRGGGTRSR